MHEPITCHQGSRTCRQCGYDAQAAGLERCPQCGWDLRALARTDCVRCGYDAGISDLENCPECGWKLSVRDVDPATFRRARRYFVCSICGLLVSGFGTCMRLPVYFSTWSKAELIVMAGLMAFAAIGMIRSCRLFRSMRLFESGDQARWYAGAAGVVFGVQLAFLLMMVL